MKQGDKDVAITVECTATISDGTTFELLITKPSGETATWTGSRSGTTIEYTTIVGDLDESGEYRLRSKVTTASGIFTGDETSFNVD